MNIEKSNTTLCETSEEAVQVLEGLHHIYICWGLFKTYEVFCKNEMIYKIKCFGTLLNIVLSSGPFTVKTILLN